MAFATTISYFGPTVTAPLWLLHNVDLSYRLAQGVGSIAFASSAFPAYFLARKVGITVRGALLATVLALLAPAGAFTSTLLSEPYSYSAGADCCARRVYALTRPTALRIAGLVALGVGLVFVGGLQLAVFLPACVGTYLLALPLRGASQRLAVATACAAVAAAAVVVLRENPNAAVALHAADRLTNERFGSMAAWLGVNAFVLAIGASWVIVPGAVLGIKSLVKHGGAGRVFSVLALLLTAGCLFEAASWSAHDQGTYERFVIYLVPLLAIAFVAWVESAGGRSRRLLIVCLWDGAGCRACSAHVSTPCSVRNSPTLTGLAASSARLRSRRLGAAPAAPCSSPRAGRTAKRNASLCRP